MLNAVSTASASPFETSTLPSAIYCTENEKCTLQVFDNRSNSNDQTPFVSAFPSPDSLSDKLHLANRTRLSILDMFLLICMSYVHVVLLVGKSWHGQIPSHCGLTTKRENWRLHMGGGTEQGRVGWRCGRPLESWDLY